MILRRASFHCVAASMWVDGWAVGDEAAGEGIDVGAVVDEAVVASVRVQAAAIAATIRIAARVRGLGRVGLRRSGDVLLQDVAVLGHVLPERRVLVREVDDTLRALHPAGAHRNQVRDLRCGDGL